jgi:hypothetical protein
LRTNLGYFGYEAIDSELPVHAAFQIGRLPLLTAQVVGVTIESVAGLVMDPGAIKRPRSLTPTSSKGGVGAFLMLLLAPCAETEMQTCLLNSRSAQRSDPCTENRKKKAKKKKDRNSRQSSDSATQYESTTPSQEKLRHHKEYVWKEYVVGSEFFLHDLTLEVCCL